MLVFKQLLHAATIWESVDAIDMPFSNSFSPT